MRVGVGISIGDLSVLTGAGPARTGHVQQIFAGSTWSEALAMTLDANGKLLVVGTVNLGAALSLPFVVSQFAFAWVVSRYNTDGTLDLTFGDYGTTYITWGDAGVAATDDECTDITVLVSGKILVAGIRTNRTGSPSMNVGCAQLNSNGTLDLSFGTNGTTQFAAGSSIYFAQVRLGVQSDGKIILGTTEILSGNGRFQVFRLLSSGAIDLSFTGGASGNATVYLVGKSSTCWAMAVDASDRIVLAGDGATGVGTQEGWFAARFNADGTPDTTFGGAGADSNGVLTLFSQPTGNTIFRIVALASGKIIAAGSTGYDASGHQQLTVGQYTTLGVLDTANFGSGTGLVSLDLHSVAGLNANQSAGGMVVLSTGKILVYGTSVGDSGGGFSDGGKFLLAQFNANGTLDTTFGSPNGYLVPSLGTTSEVFYSGVAGSAGNFYVGGHSMDDVSSPRRAVATFFKYAAGVADPTFGGLVTPPAAPAAPTVTTGASSSIGQTTATVVGTVNPNSAAATYHFDYGPTADYGLQTAETSAGSGSGNVAVTANLTGLSTNSTYHYRLVASTGTVALGSDATFLTLAGPPTIIAGLKTWISGSSTLWQDVAGTVPATADGDPVGLAVDLGTLANSFSQATAGKCPLLKLAILNGKPILRFNGTNSVLTLASVMGMTASSWTLFAVCKTTTAGATQVVLSVGADNLAGGYSLQQHVGNISVLYNGVANKDTGTVQTTNWQLLEAVFSGGVLTVYRNGVALTPTFSATPNVPATVSWIGSDTGTSELWGGDVADVLVYDHGLTIGDRTDVENYFNNLYSIW